MDSSADDSRRRPALGEWINACAVGVPAAVACLAASRLVDPRLAHPSAANAWFDSDLPFRLEVMVRPGGWENGGAHPLFPGLGHLLLAGATAATGQADPLRGAGIAGSAVGGLFAGLLFALFRRMGLARVDATLFAAIGALSSGSLFWFPVPESFGLAAAGVALALLVAASSRPSVASLAAACVASGACVLTSGIVGGLAVAAHEGRPRRWGRALTSLLVALGVMAAAWSLQEWRFRTPFFLGDRLLEYRQHTFPVTLERTGRRGPGAAVPLRGRAGPAQRSAVLSRASRSPRAAPSARSRPWPGRLSSSWAPGALCSPPDGASGASSRSPWPGASR